MKRIKLYAVMAKHNGLNFIITADDDKSSAEMQISIFKRLGRKDLIYRELDCTVVKEKNL